MLLTALVGGSCVIKSTLILSLVCQESGMAEANHLIRLVLLLFL